jgi:hypothetical protein
MDIEPPEVDVSHQRPRLNMYCPEARIPRELFWSGFGFQVWCQMLTHLIQSNHVSLFLIDEPDIYLHSDLQRQLLTLLCGLGPDILIATHSTEIITEAETDDIILVNKTRRSARRLTDPSQLQEVFSALGSTMNPVLTQLAKTRRVLFVEGKDFQIIGKFARKLNADSIGYRRDFAVVPVDGFNPERIRSLKKGMETTLGGPILAAAILDRDYRCEEECTAITNSCLEFCDYVAIHKRKEIENFLLVPAAIDRAASLKISERSQRTGAVTNSLPECSTILRAFCDSQKSYVMSQVLAARRPFERALYPSRNSTKIDETTIADFEASWTELQGKLTMVSGKSALSTLNKYLQDKHQSKYPPAKPGALELWPLKAAGLGR